MVKFLFFLKRKPGVTPEYFRDYYETKHAPLALKLFPFCKDYRRNYVATNQEHDFKTPGTKDIDFDVVTEMTFESEREFQQMVNAHADPAVAKQIADDEEKFIDRARTKSILVHEGVSSLAKHEKG